MKAKVRKFLLLATLAGLIVFVAIDSQRGGSVSGARVGNLTSGIGAVTQTPSAGNEVLPAVKGRFALPERAPFGDLQGEMFGSQSWQPPAPKVEVAPGPPPKPVAPPNPYKFAGKFLQGGRALLYLTNGNTVFAVHEGDSLDGGYRVESVDETKITLVYVPLKHIETIPVTSSLPIAEAGLQPRAVTTPPVGQSFVAGGSPIPTSAVVTLDGRSSSKPAQLAWQGPSKVKLGTRFEVILKVTSGQPLLALPMQLRFDPAYLQFVAARPGKQFDGGERKFSYRVSPDGSLFVGATNQNPAPLSDADLVVLEFRSMKPASAAQLSVSSMSLQGPAGRPIAVSQLESFRTTIFP